MGRELQKTCGSVRRSMGPTWSYWKGKSSESDFERILAELDDLIRRTEISIAELRVKEKRVLGGLLVYSLSIYLLLLASSFVLLHDQKWGYRFKFMAFFILYPILIYLLKRFISFIYRRRLNGDHMKLENLRAKQKQKVEELKNKTAYYTTKTLLDRYESPASSPSNLDLAKAQNASIKKDKKSQIGKRTRLANERSPSNKNKLFLEDETILKDCDSPTKVPDAVCASSSRRPVALLPSEDPQMYVPILEPDSLPPPVRTWADKFIDFLIGEGPGAKYALICSRCYGHNGLVAPEELDTKQFRCLYCHHRNKARNKAEDIINNLNLGTCSNDNEVPSLLRSLSEEKVDQAPPTLRHRHESPSDNIH